LSNILKSNPPLVKLLSLSLLLLIIVGCSGCGDDPVTNDNPEVYDLVAPDFIPIGFEDTIILSLSVRDPQGLDDIDIVYFEIERPDGSAEPDTFYMYDDGEDGDITNGDGIYSYSIDSSNTPQEAGDYIYHFSAEDEGNLKSNTIDHTITIDESPNPYLYDLVSPEYIQIGFPDTLGFHISVSDPQGAADIDLVYFIIENPDSTSNPDTAFMDDDGQGVDLIAGDGIYSYGLTGPIAFDQTGDHIFQFMAIDQDGHESNNIDAAIPIDDRPNPYIYNLIAPDSLVKGSLAPAYLFLKAWDPQGSDDIDSVYFWVMRPDGSSNNTRIIMFDDGDIVDHGDSVAEDGIYSRGIQAPGHQDQTGNYTFYFSAKDTDGNQANELVKIVTAYVGPITTSPNNFESNYYELYNPWSK